MIVGSVWTVGWMGPFLLTVFCDFQKGRISNFHRILGIFPDKPIWCLLFSHPGTNAHLLVQLLQPQIDLSAKVHIFPTSWISVPKLQVLHIFRWISGGWRWPPRTRVSRPVELEIIEAARLDYCTSAKVGPGLAGSRRLRLGDRRCIIRSNMFVWKYRTSKSLQIQLFIIFIILLCPFNGTIKWGPHFQTH
jgi:hypothetical protein